MRRSVVAPAAAISAGTGASWSVKWSGIVRQLYPAPSQRLASSIHPAAEAAVEACTPKRNGRDDGELLGEDTSGNATGGPLVH